MMRNGGKRWLFGAVAGTVVLLGGFVWLLQPVKQTVPFAAVSAPTIDLPNLNGTDRIRLESYLGRPVVVNFFLSDCIPCRTELPMLQAASILHEPTVAFLGINSERAVDGRAFVKKMKLSFSVGSDPDSSAAEAFGVMANPSTFFIDATGVVRSRVLGAISSKELECRISAMSDR
jgi:peroxiredoxin